MHDGSGEVFHYSECSNCGFLELTDPPQNFAKYYASNYYSHKPQGKLKSYLKGLRAAERYGRSSLLSKLLVKRFGYPPVLNWLQRVNAKADWRLLDVGCGEGIALRDLERCGFKALDGVDPFMAKDRDFGNVKLRKKSLFDVADTYDFIILNHSFEHMADQEAALAHLDKILAPDGWLLIRIPVVGNAWKTYGPNWYGIDAPRHLSIHTPKSFGLLTERSPFTTAFVDFDTDEWHYLISQQYSRGVALLSEKSYACNPADCMFTPADIDRAKLDAKRANEERQGDQASFYLRRRRP
jgi:SAM-dependent methyltransferase